MLTSLWAGLAPILASLAPYALFIIVTLALMWIMWRPRHQPEPVIHRGDPYAHPARDYRGRLIPQVR